MAGFVTYKNYGLDETVLPDRGFTVSVLSLRPGVEVKSYLRSDPAYAVYAVIIDLTVTGVDIVVTPPNGVRPLDTDGKKTSTFLLETGSDIALNASPFSPVDEGEGKPRDIIGLSASGGNVYSAEDRPWGAFGELKNGTLLCSGPPFPLDEIEDAAGGFYMVLESGENSGRREARHPRSAVGISRDGSLLVLMAVDGRQPDHSIGATTYEVGEWLRFFGAWQGLNLDGGGSTALVLAADLLKDIETAGESGKKSCSITGEYAGVNRPIPLFLVGNERVVGNHIGIRISPGDSPGGGP
jgi:hypothetical protein